MDTMKEKIDQIISSDDPERKLAECINELPRKDSILLEVRLGLIALHNKIKNRGNHVAEERRCNPL